MGTKQLFAIVFIALLLIFTGKGLAKDEIIRNELMSEGKKHSYYLFVPKSINKDKQ